MDASVGYRLSNLEVLRAQGRVLLALMIRDINTRFFGSPFGYLIAIGWPLSHSFILLMINSSIGRTIPFGDSGALWFGTGLVPFMAMSYMARVTMMGVVLNRSLLVFPIVKVTDILLARAILEMLSASVVVIATLVIYVVMGINVWPMDLTQAFYALGASMLLGLGLGILNGIIAAAVPGWITGYALVMIIMWIVSGVLFVPDALPEQYRYLLSFNPGLQGVEWMRSAYYEGYGSGVLDKGYMLSFALICLVLGLAAERIMRGRLLQ